MDKTQLFILTSGRCHSAPEEFAYDLKCLGRATIVGERTKGGAHLTQLRFFDNLGVGMWLPFGRAVNPITGTNWEGSGVEPDIPASADSALDVAYFCALKKLLETEEVEGRRVALNRLLDSLEADQR